LLLIPAGILCGCQSASSYNGRGVREFRQGDYQSALESFQNAVATNPSDADAYYNLAATLHDWGRRSDDDKLLEQSEGLYHRCLDLDENHVDCYRALAVLLVDTQRKESAFTLLEKWAQRSPQLSSPRVELARLHEEFGDDESALQYLAQALDVDSRNSRAWAAMGRLREREGRYAQALTDYQHAYNLNRYHPGVPQRIAALQQRVAQAPRGVSGGGPNETRITRSSSTWVPR
jgi:tetratricopeptide (TPR) repeat protein